MLALGFFALPGIVFHELGHYLFCKIAGARVYRVVYFRFGNPAGYVIHATPRRFRDHFAIVVGPFILNSLTGFLLFSSVVGKWTRPVLASDVASGVQLQTLVLAAIALWLGVSVSLQAFPSRGDARSLWQVTNRHIRHGNVLAIVGYPVVGMIYLVNMLRRLGLDWAYACALLALAVIAF